MLLGFRSDIENFRSYFQRAQQLIDEDEDDDNDNDMQDDEPDKSSFDEEVERNTEANIELTAGATRKPNGVASGSGN